MKNRLYYFGGFLKETYQSGLRDNVPDLAAALSYYAVFSLTPIFVLVVFFAGFLFQDEFLADRLIYFLGETMGTEVSNFFATLSLNISEMGTSTIMIVVSAILLVYLATTLLSKLGLFLDRIFDEQKNGSIGFWPLLKKRFVSLIFVFGLGFIFVSMSVANTLFVYLRVFMHENLPQASGFLNWQMLNNFFYFLVTVLIFALIYGLLSRGPFRLVRHLPGAVFAGFLFVIMNFILSFALKNVIGAGIFYGTAGSLVIILIWVNYSLQILLYGAEFSKTYLRRQGKSVLDS